MIVIADSGSTKTDWCLGNTKTNSRTVRTGGINPFHQSVDEIKEVIASTLIPQLGDTTEFTTIYFYGAGCIPEKTNIVKTALAQNFPKANILVESDLLGAAHALCGKTAGIACILGTGSNSCFYDGEKITANISPLGYILGDEGSGAVLGKRLVGDLLKHQLPDDLCQDFLKEYDLTPALILDKVYRQPLANRFLAGLTPFLFAHKHRPEIRNLLISCFTDFFTRNVMQYEYHDILVHFTGSIAFLYYYYNLFVLNLKKIKRKFNNANIWLYFAIVSYCFVNYMVDYMITYIPFNICLFIICLLINIEEQ